MVLTAPEAPMRRCPTEGVLLSVNLPFWPFYVGDYLADTMHLDAHEHGAYLLLMMAYWKRQKPLDDDPKDLAQITHMTLSAFEACRSRLAPFFKIEGGKWVHGRLERDILKQKLKYHAQSQAAAMTNAKLHPKKQITLSDTLSDKKETLSVSQPEPEPEPEPKSEQDVGSNGSKSTGKRVNHCKVPDDEWLSGLKSDPAYLGIDVPLQFARMKRWCSEHDKVASRRRFINWLNRCDRAVTISSQQQLSMPIDHSNGF